MSGSDQVHHRNMGEEIEAVGTGHRHVRLFQSANHAVEERIARAHKNQHVTGG